MRVREIWLWTVPAAAWFALVAGCNKADLSDALSQGTKGVTEAVAKTTEIVKEQAQLAGSIELVLDGSAVKTGRCYVSLTSLASGRPAVLQVTAYKEPVDETFPSVLFRGETPSGSLAELGGQSLTGSLYVQIEENGPVWQSPPDRPVTWTIATAAEDSIEGQLASGTLVRSDSGEEATVSGTFNGVIH